MDRLNPVLLPNPGCGEWVNLTGDDPFWRYELEML